MFNAMALSVPFPKFSGFLDFDPSQSHIESTTEIRKFYKQLNSDNSNEKLHFPIDLPRLEDDLDRGLFFNSNIPQQYGVGSSGALVAALFTRYARLPDTENTLSPEVLKADFALLEGFFHGRSSGLDPLTSFLNKALVVDSDKKIRIVDFDLAGLDMAVALIDTNTTGATAPLVKHFIDLFNLPEFKLAFEQQFLPSNNGCIESILIGDLPHFINHLEQLVKFERYHFFQMIPAHFHRVISFAHCEKVYIKLLGSGGGGYLLAFAESKEWLTKWSEKRKIQLQIIKE